MEGQDASMGQETSMVQGTSMVQDAGMGQETSMGENTYAGEGLVPVTPGEANVRFDERGLVTVVVQQEGTGEVLMVAWANEEALRLTMETGTSWFWSRSRQELWNKGATSGNVQQVRRILVDCDADTLVYVVDSPGPACHTGARSCFYRQLVAGGEDAS